MEGGGEDLPHHSVDKEVYLEGERVHEPCTLVHMSLQSCVLIFAKGYTISGVRRNGDPSEGVGEEGGGNSPPHPPRYLPKQKRQKQFKIIR